MLFGCTILPIGGVEHTTWEPHEPRTRQEGYSLSNISGHLYTVNNSGRAVRKEKESQEQ